MSDPNQAFDHRSHPPATALGPDVDDDEGTPVTDDDEVVDGVEQLTAPGEAPEAPDDSDPAGS